MNYVSKADKKIKDHGAIINKLKKELNTIKMYMDSSMGDIDTVGISESITNLLNETK